MWCMPRAGKDPPATARTSGCHHPRRTQGTAPEDTAPAGPPSAASRRRVLPDEMPRNHSMWGMPRLSQTGAGGMPLPDGRTALSFGFGSLTRQDSPLGLNFVVPGGGARRPGSCMNV